MPSTYTHVPHPRVAQRKREGPTKVRDQLTAQTPAARFNAWLAVKITDGVGTMWCAYAFAALALVSLPQAIRGGTAPLIQWIAQTFLQLVLLSIIIVGQNIQSAAADKRSQATYEDADAVLHEAEEIQKHLAAQDAQMSRIAEQLAAIRPGS
jgi:hypothetical protein